MQDAIGYLVLSTGDVLEGKWLGSPKITEGEVVFNTSMTGYQEIVTDSSYAGQIVTMTFPSIGASGWNEADYESLQPSLAGIIVSTPSHLPEHYESSHTLPEMLEKYQIPALSHIDTRALTRIIRDNGEIYGKITADPHDSPKWSSVSDDIVSTVSIKNNKMMKTEQNVYDHSPHVVVVDYGCKKSIETTLLASGCDVTVVPYDSSFVDIQSIDPDGVILSNGPGNPTSLNNLYENIQHISDYFPTLGLGLGHQLLALANGASTDRLSYGHRGSNHAVKNVQTGKVMITSQNHGYIVNEQSIDQDNWDITHVNVNDRSIEGLQHKYKRIMSIQFDLTGNPGPKDSYPLFEEFIQQFVAKGEKQHA